MAFNLNPFKKTSSNQPTQSGFGQSSGVGESKAPQETELSALDFSNSQQGAIEVTEIATGIGVVYEEAAVLYANGNDRDAEQLLTA
ncbi:MAG: hypothetical protein FWD51_02145, partial [Betaproteobacteria bacterium]|nr:hypothetical protein [Betaproteobacteria bacterium]